MLETALALALALPAAPMARSELPFLPDERSDYTVSYLGVKVGTAQIRVGRPEGLVLPLLLLARTGGIASFMDVREQLISYLDAESRLPRSFILEATEGSYRHSQTTRFARKAGTATVTSKSRYERTEVVDVPARTLDFVAMVFLLRTLPLEPGQEHRFQVLAGTKVQPVVAEVVGRERVETRAGAFPAVKVRVPTGFTGKFSEKDPTYIWFSDDARRVVVRVATDFAIGHAVATLTGYQAGVPPPDLR